MTIYTKFIFFLTGGGCISLYLELENQKKINSDLNFKCSVLSEKIYKLEASNLAAQATIETQQKTILATKNISILDYLYNNADFILVGFGAVFCLLGGCYLYNQISTMSVNSDLIIQKVNSLTGITTENASLLNTKLYSLVRLTNTNKTILDTKLNELILKQDYQIVSLNPLKNLLLNMTTNSQKVYPMVLKINPMDPDTGYALATNEAAQHILHLYANIPFPG